MTTCKKFLKNFGPRTYNIFEFQIKIIQIE